MPITTRKSKILEAENHGMVLRKPRNSNAQASTSQRKAFNEIGNVVRKYDARTSLAVDYLKDKENSVKEMSLRRSTRNSVSSIGRRMSSVTTGPSVRSACGSQSGSINVSKPCMGPPIRRVVKAKQVEPSNDHVLPQAEGQSLAVKRKSTAVVKVRRAPRLTLKPVETPPGQNQVDEANTAELPSRQHNPGNRLTLNLPQSLRINVIPVPKFLTTLLPLPRVAPTEPRKKDKYELISSKDDIDVLHRGCLWMVSTYSKHIFRYLQKLERQLSIEKFLIDPPTLPEEMRASIIDWLGSIYLEMRLYQETFLLSVSLLDRYLAESRETEYCQLQLIALSCLYISIKFEEMFPISMKELLSLAKHAYTKEQVLKMEADVIKALNFRIARPVAIMFLRRFNFAARCDRVQHSYGKYLIDLAQLDRALAYKRPSCLAAAAVYVAICIKSTEVSSQLWSPVLRHYTTFSYDDIHPIVSQIAAIAVTGGGQLRSIRRKYSTTAAFRVADKVELQLPLLQTLSR